MTDVKNAAAKEDVDGARAAFNGDAHDITHDIDQPLRVSDPELARSLCDAVLILERQLSGTQEPPIIAEQAGIAAGLLTEAAAALEDGR